MMTAAFLTRVQWRLIGLSLIIGLIFALFPQIDLTIARLFYLGEGHFVGENELVDVLRRIGYFTPASVLILSLVTWGLAKWKKNLTPAPSGRAVLFLCLSMALGPGLLVNLILKDHWHRPRPVQVVEFQGEMEFRPWYRLDGQCQVNCSFVSGETSSAFWMLAPALITPGPWQGPAMVGALVFGALVGLLRMALGGHFLSDVLLAATLTSLVVLTLYRLLYPRRDTPPPQS
jgi:membrane-associated phospholipid phosphatase